MSSSGPSITVIGSINMDLVIRCAALPSPGQTLLAHSSREVCGGKGANQAVAAARAGGQVTMIGRVGNDAFAQRLTANLQQEGIETTYVQPTDDCASGLAIVAVEDSGQNSILVVPGANGRVSVADVLSAQDIIQESDIVLMQLEIPLDAVAMAIRLANQANVRIILDPAPAPAVWPPDLFQVDLMCPNESEAAALTGTRIVKPKDAAAAGHAFHDRGCRNVVITMGPKGAVVSSTGEVRSVAPFAVDAVDTTAAGDAFAGALAVRWAETDDLALALQFGSAAGALSASRAGLSPR